MAPSQSKSIFGPTDFQTVLALFFQKNRYLVTFPYVAEKVNFEKDAKCIDVVENIVTDENGSSEVFVEKITNTVLNENGEKKHQAGRKSDRYHIFKKLINLDC